MLVLALVSPLALVAHDAHDSPSRPVASFHKALAGGDQEAVLRLLDAQVTIFESCGVELSRDECASHHLGADRSGRNLLYKEIYDSGPSGRSRNG